MGSLAELNVTPMIDLAFVLLIIFMITAPLLASRVDWILPTSRAQRDAVPPERTLVIGMNREGDLDIEGAAMTQAELAGRVRRELSGGSELGVLIRADESLTLSRVMPLLDLLKSAGVADVGFVARSGMN